METPLGLEDLLNAVLELSFLQPNFSPVYLCELLNRLGSRLAAYIKKGLYYSFLWQLQDTRVFCSVF